MISRRLVTIWLLCMGLFAAILDLTLTPWEAGVASAEEAGTAPPPTPRPAAIPKGAVIGWIPPAGTPATQFPPDGQDGRPQIGEVFLYGTPASRNGVGSSGGRPTHSHKVTTLPATANNPNRGVDNGGDFNTNDSGHGHIGNTDEVSNLPPFVRVVWLCLK